MRRCGDCAVSKLKELARGTYFIPKEYEVPTSDAILWRYMDFTKFVSLLSTCSLYFPSAACFDDIFEGAKGPIGRKNTWDAFYLDFFRRSGRTIPRNVQLVPPTDDDIEKDAQRLLRELEVAGNFNREHTFISCWHESTHESEAMWRLYSTSTDQALAICTSVGSVRAALGNTPDISIGRVEYIDYDSSFASISGAFWKKRKSFEHEREVRLLFTDYSDDNKLGIAVPCNISELITSVVVSPKTPEWFFPLVVDVVARFGQKSPVKKSELTQVPFF